MKILIIDCNIDPPCWGSPDISWLLRKFDKNISWETRRGPQMDFPVQLDYDRIIISGSKTSAFDSHLWVKKTMSFIEHVVENKIPLLGICYGFQILIRAYGGKEALGKSKPPEFGWTKITTTKKSELFEGLENPFYSFSAHYDEVVNLPKGFVKTAHSEYCEIQAAEKSGEPVFGIQFHPEKPSSEADLIVREKMKEKKVRKLAHPHNSQAYFNEKVGEVIFSNFLNLPSASSSRSLEII